MNPWLVLGIKETTDKEEVRKAYMTMVSKNNPEDDPQGFQNIRMAYETALKQIAEKEKPEDTSPVGLFMSKLEALYKNFAERIDPENWEELLSDDVCVSLETEDEVSDRVLEFLMSNFHLPSAVFVLLCEKFGWEAQQERLQKFPPDFISFILGHSEEIFKCIYRYFEEIKHEDIDFDRFLYLRRMLCNHMDNRRLDEAREIAEELEAMDINHPGRRLELARYLSLTNRQQEALDMVNELFEKYDFHDDLYAKYTKASVLLAFEDEEKIRESKRLLLSLLDVYPDYYWVHLDLISAFHRLEEWEECDEFINEKSLRSFPSNASIINSHYSIKMLLVEKYEKLIENPTDEICLKLADYYSCTNQYDKCHELLMSHGKIESAEYYDLLAVSSSLGKKDFRAAEEAALKAVEIKPNITHYKTLVMTRLEAEKFREALESVEEALRLPDVDSKNRARFYKNKANAHRKLRELDKAIDAIDKAIELQWNLADVYCEKAEILRDMGSYAEAVYAAEDALALLPVYGLPYEIMAEIFYKTGNIEQIDQLAERVKSFEQDKELPGIVFLKACALHDEKKFEEAVEMLNKLLEMEHLGKWELKAIEELAYIHDKYDSAKAPAAWRRCLEAHKNHERAYSRLATFLFDNNKTAEALELIDEGIKNNPDSPNLHVRKAYILLNTKDYARSNEEFLLALEFPHEKFWWKMVDIYYEIGRTFFSNLNDAEKAMKYFELAYELDSGDAEINWYLGELYVIVREDFQKAFVHYNKAVELDSSFIHYYSRAKVHLLLGNETEAKSDFDKVMFLCGEDNDKYHDKFGYMGLVCIARNDTSGAKKYIKKAEKMMKTDGTENGKCHCVYSSWAQYYLAAGKYKKALENIEIALSLANSARNNLLKNEILAKL